MTDIERLRVEAKEAQSESQLASEKANQARIKAAAEIEAVVTEAKFKATKALEAAVKVKEAERDAQKAEEKEATRKYREEEFYYTIGEDHNYLGVVRTETDTEIHFMNNQKVKEKLVLSLEEIDEVVNHLFYITQPKQKRQP